MLHQMEISSEKIKCSIRWFYPKSLDKITGVLAIPDLSILKDPMQQLQIIYQSVKLCTAGCETKNIILMTLTRADSSTVLLPDPAGRISQIWVHDRLMAWVLSLSAETCSYSLSVSWAMAFPDASKTLSGVNSPHLLNRLICRCVETLKSPLLFMCIQQF